MHMNINKDICIYSTRYISDGHHEFVCMLAIYFFSHVAWKDCGFSKLQLNHNLGKGLLVQWVQVLAPHQQLGLQGLSPCACTGLLPEAKLPCCAKSFCRGCSPYSFGKIMVKLVAGKSCGTPSVRHHHRVITIFTAGISTIPTW